MQSTFSDSDPKLEKEKVVLLGSQLQGEHGASPYFYWNAKCV